MLPRLGKLKKSVVVMLNGVMLSAVMLNVIMLAVVAASGESVGLQELL